ncbi:ATP synthase subunit d, mitochondrial-like [Artemia franciscana]
MASKRIARSSIDWAKMAESVPESQKAMYNQFKAKSDGYIRKALSYPEQPSPINWEHYRKSLTNPAMVDAFKKQYEALKVPYPEDKVSSQIDAQEAEAKKEITKFIQESRGRIENYKAELGKLGQMIPFEHMTLEDFFEAFPEKALNPENPKSFWPHTEEDTLEFKEKKLRESRDEHH